MALVLLNPHQGIQMLRFWLQSHTRISCTLISSWIWFWISSCSQRGGPISKSTSYDVIPGAKHQAPQVGQMLPPCPSYKEIASLSRPCSFASPRTRHETDNEIDYPVGASHKDTHPTSNMQLRTISSTYASHATNMSRAMEPWYSPKDVFLESVAQ